MAHGVSNKSVDELIKIAESSEITYPETHIKHLTLYLKDKKRTKFKYVHWTKVYHDYKKWSKGKAYFYPDYFLQVLQYLILPHKVHKNIYFKIKLKNFGHKSYEKEYKKYIEQKKTIKCKISWPRTSFKSQKY